MMRRFITSSLALAFSVLPAVAITNPAVYALAVLQITTALTSSAQTAITSLAGATAVSIECSFTYGSGGTTASATIQTSMDGGTTWRDVTRCDFTTATRVAYGNLSGLTAKNVATFAALASEGVNDGLLGDQLRAVVTTTGTYVNTTLSVRASVR